jgi:hypothetical protein
MRKAIFNLAIMVFISCKTFAIENSIIPTMEHFEHIENLPSNKFTKRQFAEIAEALARKEDKIRLVTYNMLFNLYDQHLTEENRWPSRLPRIAELIKEMQSDIISTQELYPNQAQDMSELISEDFAFFPGQKDEDGESYGIFYRKDRFELLSSKVIYPLSAIQLKILEQIKFSMFSIRTCHFVILKKGNGKLIPLSTL